MGRVADVPVTAAADPLALVRAVGARCDRLRLQRCGAPRGGRLARHDAEQVVLQVEHDDGGRDVPARLHGLHHAPVVAAGAARQRDPREGRRREADRTGQRVDALQRVRVPGPAGLRLQVQARGGDVRPPPAGAVRQDLADAGREVGDGQAGSGVHLQVAVAVGLEQHPHRRGGEDGARRARVVGADDLLGASCRAWPRPGNPTGSCRGRGPTRAPRRRTPRPPGARGPPRRLQGRRRAERPTRRAGRTGR